METHTVINVPQNYYSDFVGLNKWWFEGSIEMRQNAISCAFNFHENFINSIGKFQESEKLKRERADKEGIKSSMSATIDTLNESLESKSSSIQKLENRNTQLVNEMNIIYDDAYREANERAHKKMEIEMNAKDNTISILNNQIDKITGVKKDEVDRIISERDKWQQKCDKIQDEHNKMVRELIESKTRSTKKKGCEGEDWLGSVLVQEYPTMKIEDTHGKSRMGDYIMTIDTNDGKSIKILYDSKNYANNSSVRSKNIDQLLRDMEHTDACIGILVSLNGGIVGMSHLTMKFCPGNRVIVPIHNAIDNRDNIRMATEAGIAAWMNLSSQCFSPDERISMLEKINSVVCELGKMGDDIKNMEKSLNNMKDGRNKMIQSLQETIPSAPKQTKKRRGRARS